MLGNNSPINIFDCWYQEMLEVSSYVQEPSAMVLATCEYNKPSARVVLLKKYGEAGFEFFTNLQSRKGKEIAANPFVALVFDWRHIGRQVRVEGDAEFMDASESDAYHASRTRESQVGAWCSKQSEILESRGNLLRQVELIDERFRGVKVPRPAYWGGIRVIPHCIEFWQEGAHRLHTRELYSKTYDGSWKYVELYP